MTLIQGIILVVLILIIIDVFFRKHDIFSPSRVFSITWGISIFLAEYKFSGFQHQWSSYSWFVFILGIVAFLSGCFFSYTVILGREVKSISEIREKVQKETPDKLYKVSIVLFIIYFISYIIEVSLVGYIPLLSLKADRARIEFGIFGIHLIVSLQMALSIINCEYLMLSDDRRKKRIIWGILIVSFITFGALLQRFSFLLSAFIIFSIVYYGSKKITKKKIFITVLIFFSMLWFIQSIRVASYVQNFIYQISKMKYSEQYAVFTEPYMYVTMNLENMSRGIEKLEQNTYGLMTFDWIAALTGIKHWSQQYFSIEPRPFLVSGYNTFPFMWDYYYDFGILGVAFLPMLLGFIISYIYYNMKINPNLSSVVYYSICISIMLISFFTNPLALLGVVANIFAVFFIHNFILNKN